MHLPALRPAIELLARSSICDGRPPSALHLIVAVLTALLFSFAAPDARAGEPIGVLYSGLPQPAKPPTPDPPPPCTENCFLLSKLVLRGSVNGGLSFELYGVVRAHEETKIPLFGPPGQVRLDEVTIDGVAAQIGFDSDHYEVFTSSRSFVLRGKIQLGSDQLLSIPGPVVMVDARLSKGRVIEGERLSGVTGSVLHFDPEEGEESERAKSRVEVKSVFRLSRAIRIGRETSFLYRLVVSQGPDLGTVRLPLRYGEKVGDVQGAQSFRVEGTELLLAVNGHEADLTISGTLPEAQGTRSFTPDERSTYEWWLIESDPEHRIATGGEPKLVENSQSPIPASMPGARVYLVQRGQALEVDARSLVRGDVLAAVVRDHRRFVAVTGSGELISDEAITYDNNGLDHLMVTPAGKAMYLSIDGSPQRILHTEAGAKAVLVPISTGKHSLRVQSLADVRLWPFAGMVSIPPTTYPVATSATETTIGLPEHVKPIAVLGGDRIRWAFARADLIAIVLGVGLACFGFRERRTRALGALATAGLWFVSREAFVVVTAGLFVAGAIFLASRFLRGTFLLATSGLAVVLALFTSQSALSLDATSGDRSRGMLVERPDLPQPDPTTGAGRPGDPTAAVTPVSLSFPSSERYVQTSRQLVTSERPFVPRVIFVTSTLTAALHVLWLALALLLAWAHRQALALLKERIKERLMRRPDPRTAPEAPPF